MNLESKIKISKKLKNRDYLLLKNLYYYRCLSLVQAWDLCYRDAGVDLKTFIQKRVGPFAKLNLIKLSHSGKSYVLSITDDGISILADKISLNNDYFDIKTKKMRSGILKESAIRLLPRLMEHQIALNQFVVDFSRKLRKKEKFKNLEFQYFDEKFMSKYSYIRPDGMLSFPKNKLDLFLEMDMGTESQKQLIDKWAKYRLSLSSDAMRSRDSKIIVLFILDNLPPDKIETRKNIVRYTIDQTLTDDYIDKFDIYIGTRNELMNSIFEKILPIELDNYFLKELVVNTLLKKKHGFVAGEGSKLKKIFYDASYAFYIRKINQQNRIRIQDGKVQEFLFDDYLYEPMSVLNKIQFHRKHSSLFEVYYKRPIDYIVLVQNLEIIYRDLSVTNSLDIPGVFFTTADRLVNLPLNEALVQFDSMGAYYHFSDYSFTTRILEGYMND